MTDNNYTSNTITKFTSFGKLSENQWEQIEIRLNDRDTSLLMSMDKYARNLRNNIKINL